MAKGAKETKGQPEVKKPQVKNDTKGSCGCGCILPIRTR